MAKMFDIPDTFSNQPKKKRRFTLFEFTRIMGFVALGLSVLYWAGGATYAHRWIARGLVFSVLMVNLVFDRLIYRREMKRREEEIKLRKSAR